MFERNSRNANNIIGFTRNVNNSRENSNRKPSGTYRTSATARMPATVWMQVIAVTQATTVTPATSNIKKESNIMTAHNSRNASNSRNESNNRTGNTVWMPPKAEMLARTVKPTTAWMEANSSKDNGNITVSTAEGRPITKRMPEIEETSQQQY
jgi:hypothetical protein